MNDRIRELVVHVAASNIGFGETTGNNRGRFIDLIGGELISTDNPEWCALFAGYCYRRAYQLLGQTEPAWLFRRPGVPEPGARRLVRGLGDMAGMYTYENSRLVKPGDLGLLERKGGHHVFVVEKQIEGVVHTIAGNEGRFPSKVKRTVRFKDGRNEKNFVCFAGLR